MALIVYVLCALTSLVCSVLLIRGYMRQKVRLLLWCALCFVGLTLNNIFLILDIVVFPEVTLWHVRSLSGLVAMMLLVFGLVWDA
jgi:hypothetical protein